MKALANLHNKLKYAAIDDSTHLLYAFSWMRNVQSEVLRLLGH